MTTTTTTTTTVTTSTDPAAAATSYLRYTLADAELAKPDGGGVLFFCMRGRHRSSAAVAGYIVRCTGRDPDEVMREVAEKSAAQRGEKSKARFHEERSHSGNFPPLAPLVRALANLRRGPRLPEC